MARVRLAKAPANRPWWQLYVQAIAAIVPGAIGILS
jgi:hypothetical protein